MKVFLKLFFMALFCLFLSLVLSYILIAYHPEFVRSVSESASATTKEREEKKKEEAMEEKKEETKKKSDAGKNVTAVTDVNVRSDPEMGDNIMGVLPQGCSSKCAAKVLESGWQEIIYNGSKGYVYSDYLKYE